MKIGSTGPPLARIQQLAFRRRLEDHLGAVKAGQAGSSEVHEALKQKHDANARHLARGSPDDAHRYLSLLSGLSYDQGARVVAAVNETATAVAQLAEVREKTEAEQARFGAAVEKYGDAKKAFAEVYEGRRFVG